MATSAAPVSDQPASASIDSALKQQTLTCVLASSLFTKAPLLSSFLTYICRRSFEDEAARISEHEIALQVFHRPSNFDPREDNIVRTYVRHLRKRLQDYYAAEGQKDALQIAIPKGGYVPVFVTRAEAKAESQEKPPSPDDAARRDLQQPIETPTHRPRHKFAVTAGLLLVYSAVLACATWLLALRWVVPHPQPDPSATLWKALLGASERTFIVPADAGLNLLEDVSQHALPLVAYLNGSYQTMALPGIDGHSADDMRSQELTSFVDLQIVTDLERRPEFNPQHATIRFPRELHVEDLKNANAIILGSEESNPWASIAEAHANFRIIAHEGMKGATLVNTSPRPGEAASYVSHWDEPAHETFAVISYLPNLAGTGHLLLLQGLDVAGTQAAAEALFHPNNIAAILKRATRRDGSLRPFEILLRATSLDSNATGTQVIATRIY